MTNELERQKILDDLEKGLDRPFIDHIVRNGETANEPNPDPTSTAATAPATPKKSGKWTLIAKRGKDFLWDRGDGMGIITSNSRVVPDVLLPVQSILARGYWEPVDGSPSRI